MLIVGTAGRKMGTSVSSVNLFESLPEISDLSHQPGFWFKFPKRSFGKARTTQRSFQVQSF